MSTTDPIEDIGGHTAPRIVVAATYQDPVTKALYVHRDLVNVQTPWAEGDHIPPTKRTERFGDVESWAAYIIRFAGAAVAAPLLTWNKCGLSAVLDYPTSRGEPGRCQWLAIQPFVASAQWQAWMALANGRPVSQKEAIERLEDMAADIIEPSGADVAHLLRNLRGSVKATADTELRPDGSSRVVFSRDSSVKSGEIELPGRFLISIQVLKGHINREGQPVYNPLAVRLRTSIGDDAHLALRFTIPMAERVLEDVYADRVKLAREVLGEAFQLLRAAE